MKHYLNLFLIILFSIVLFSCNGTEKKQSEVVKLPTIDENTETELIVWGWNVAAKASTGSFPHSNRDMIIEARRHIKQITKQSKKIFGFECRSLLRKLFKMTQGNTI